MLPGVVCRCFHEVPFALLACPASKPRWRREMAVTLPVHHAEHVRGGAPAPGDASANSGC